MGDPGRDKLIAPEALGLLAQSLVQQRPGLLSPGKDAPPRRTAVEQLEHNFLELDESGRFKVVNALHQADLRLRGAHLPDDSVTNDTAKGLDTFYGYQDLKAKLRRDVIKPLTASLKKDPNPLAPKPLSGILLYGPKGIGKTTLAKAIAEELGAKLYEINSETAGSKYAHVFEQKVMGIYAEARKAERISVVLIDDAHGRLKTVGSDESSFNFSELATLQNCMADDKNPGKVLTILTSPQPHLIDPDTFRPGRIDREYLVPFDSSVESKRFFLREFLKTYPYDQSISVNAVAERMTENLIPNDIRAIVDTAARIGFSLDHEFITESDLTQAVQDVEPSLDPVAIKEQQLNRKDRRDSNYGDGHHI